MIFNRYNLFLLIRFISILCTMALLVIVITVWQLIFLSIGIAVVLIIQLIALFHHLTSTTRATEKFIQTLTVSDFTTGFQLKKYKGDHEKLEKAMKSVLELLKEAEHARQGEHLVLKKMVEHLPTGIIVRKNEAVIVMNHAASELLETPRISSWNRLVHRFPELDAQTDSTLTLENSPVKRSLHVTPSEMHLKNDSLIIYTISNLQPIISESEIQSYQKLNRILSHEIQNSVSPIISLSQLAIEKVRLNDTAKLEELLQVIHQKSEGLKEFVSRFQTLHQIPSPLTRETLISSFLQGVKTLFSGDLLEGQEISINVVPSILEIDLDPGQIELCLTNLVKNSLEAQLENQPIHIALSAYRKGKYKIIEVSDNGCGIPTEIQEMVLVPFFTTKDQGSGIGLSLAHQFMANHGGHLQISSSDQGTSIYLVFNA